MEKIEKENIKNITNKIIKFKNIIKSKDYFRILFNIFKDIIEFKNNNINDIEIFNSEDKYKQLIDISYTFNKESIFDDILSNL